jgi:hypothetical protein
MESDYRQEERCLALFKRGGILFFLFGGGVEWGGGGGYRRGVNLSIYGELSVNLKKR